MNTLSIMTQLILFLSADEERFRAAESDVETPILRSVFRELSLQRRKFSNAVQTLARSITEGEVETGLSDAASFHTPEWTPRDELAILAACENGDAATIAQYERVLVQSGIPDDAILTLHDQYLKVREAGERMRILRETMESADALPAQMVG
jgi:uncharacterized protein (TIGR02284 family)